MPPKEKKTREREKKSDAKGSTRLNSDERATEMLFLMLVFVVVASALFGFIQSAQFRAMVAGIFHPTSLSYYRSANGARVFVSAAQANVRESPGGIRIGSQEHGALGTIVDTPVLASKRFWDIDFDAGVDGWVDEAELLLVKPQTFLARVVGEIVTGFRLLSTFLSLLFFSGIVYSLIRISQLIAAARKRERLKESPAHAALLVEDHASRRWDRVVSHVQSESPADWRLAILEADIMLAELLEKMGYRGENVGEKLKTIERSDFTTIDDAWEAHKVRNLIAHQGSDYVLSRREAQRVIGLYANVFREFRFIAKG